MLPEYRCKRCGYKWVPRTDKPLTCPKCRSPYWYKERRNGEIKDGKNNNIERKAHT